MDNPTIYGNTKKFKLPSGYEVTIREQNGEDDDILSNRSEAAELRNLSAFIASLVVDTDITDNRLLTPEQAHKLPALDRYTILINSRIFSLGEILEFQYNWGTKEKPREYEYEFDLRELVFDYGEEPTAEILEEKLRAVPFYPNSKQTKDLSITTSSGKELLFDLMTGEGEAYMLNLPLEKDTKNQELIARNLRLNVEGKWEKVTNFRLFSVKDMAEIRSIVRGYDPVFKGLIPITNPDDGTEVEIPVMAVSSFFYLREN